MSCTVYQYFGEKFFPTGFKVFYTEPDNLEYENFDCSILKQSLGLNFDKFKLTELELLSSSDLNTWLSYCATEAHDGETELLGIKLMKNLMDAEGYDIFIERTAKIFENILKENLTPVAENFQGQEKTEILAKFETALSWFKSLYSNYYGKTYLVQVGDSSVGVCIKDRYGNAPSGNVKVEPEGGIFYSSDSPSVAGGWLAKNQNQVMGLSVGPELYPFVENDNRIGCFVQFTQSTGISKLSLTWDINLSRFGDQSFYQKNSDLYVKADISPTLYQLDGKQYVLVTLSNMGELKLDPNTLCPNILGSAGAQSVIILHGTSFIEPLKTAACDDPTNVNNGTVPEFSNINLFKFEPPAVCPENFCLPFKSNVFTYGPWFFQANPVGGTEVAVDKELAPWNFSILQNNGYDIMNYYGSLMAGDGPRGLQKMETGSITVASLPSYGIGYTVGSNAGTLTDIQINIGESGYTTTYNFSRYTPKFGKPGRHLSDLWSRNFKSMSYLHKFFKEQNLEIKGLLNQAAQKLQNLKYTNTKPRMPSDNPITEAAGTPGEKTPHMFLYSSYRVRPKETNNDGGTDSCDNSPGMMSGCSPCLVSTPGPIDSTQCPPGPANSIKNIPITITETSKHKTWYREHFHRMAFNTLDLMFCGISTNQENDPEAELPRLAMYQDFDANFMEYKDKGTANYVQNNKTRLEIPPFYFDDIVQYDLPIHQMYLNSVTSLAMLNEWDGRKGTSNEGFITNVISFGELAKDFTLSGLPEDEDKKQEATNFRYSVLRGPLSLQSWGYDTTGKPIPNMVDSPLQAEKGKFRRRGLKDKFLTNWLSNPKTWPAGPIDLRWDRERGVWVAPPSNKIVVARLLTPLMPLGVADAELIDPQAGGVSFYQEYDLWSADGINIKKSMNKTKIKVYDFLGIRLCKCDIIYAYYDDNRYIVLESNRAYRNPNEACCPVSTTTTMPSPTLPSVATPTSCWSNLEHLKNLPNFKEGKHQALVHKKVAQGPDCLEWEDIVECYTPTPRP